MIKFSAKRLLPLSLLILGLIVFFYFRLYHYLSFEQLQAHRALLLQWTEQHYIWASLGYIVIYTLAVAVSIPGAIFLTLLGGFLFGIVMGVIYTVFAATLGATILFLAVKLAFADVLASRASTWVQRMQQGFQQDAFNYLLVLRLIPIFPFWGVNIVPALLNVPLRTYVIATLLGIIPGTAVYVALGNGLGQLLAENKTPNLGIIFTPSLLLPLIALAILALLPALYRRWKQRKESKSH